MHWTTYLRIGSVIASPDNETLLLAELPLHHGPNCNRRDFGLIWAVWRNHRELRSSVASTKYTSNSQLSIQPPTYPQVGYFGGQLGGPIRPKLGPIRILATA